LVSRAFPNLDTAIGIADAMASWPAGEFARREPDKLWNALIDAEWAHDQALELGAVAPALVKSYKSQAAALKKALEEIETAEFMLADFEQDLRRVMRQAIKHLDEMIETLGNNRDPITGKTSRLIRAPELPVKSDGIDALVRSLASYWLSNSDHEFSETTIDQADIDADSMVPHSAAACLVFRAATSVHERYSLSTCMNSIRRYRERAKLIPSC
jgi:hypothetical protein